MVFPVVCAIDFVPYADVPRFLCWGDSDSRGPLPVPTSWSASSGAMYGDLIKVRWSRNGGLQTVPRASFWVKHPRRRGRRALSRVPLAL